MDMHLGSKGAIDPARVGEEMREEFGRDVHVHDVEEVGLKKGGPRGISICVRESQSVDERKL